MIPAYESRKKEFFVEWKNSVHVPPHLHEAMELVYVTSGTLEFGIGPELYHMEEGDFAIVFPNVIHHYQVWGGRENRAIYVFVDAAAFPAYVNELWKFRPVYPVLCRDSLHDDVANSMKALAERNENNEMLARAYVQMILAHVFSEMDMMEKDTSDRDDIVYKSVEYVAKNFREDITLEKMAKELGVGKYVLSRMFSKTFHCNFSKYVNGIRLNYAAAILENSKELITNLCLECGFESQRTFNRVFKEKYKMTPREYRNRMSWYRMQKD
ncbi:MAG: helix-turn-helix transcriptional regulator [Lachnospiraceae bacterium]|nr:helix-turn-helix transcriptional regulator [Lachnospiraceae bacterium]